MKRVWEKNHNSFRAPYNCRKFVWVAENTHCYYYLLSDRFVNEPLIIAADEFRNVAALLRKGGVDGGADVCCIRDYSSCHHIIDE